MLFSNAVAFFVNADCGRGAARPCVHEIRSTAESRVRTQPLAGEFAFALFTLGIVGTACWPYDPLRLRRVRLADVFR
jgi:hypothetical protein